MANYKKNKAYWVNRDKRPLRGKERIKRICLGTACEDEFIADSKFVRLCPKCRKEPKYKYI